MSKIDYKSLHEVCREVKLWQDGTAEFDYTICGELQIEDKNGNTVFVHATYIGSQDHLVYFVSRYSAFDEAHFGEPDYVIQHFEGNIEECAKSKYYRFLVLADEIVDQKFRENLAKLDDTRNYPGGRMCSVNFGLYYEMYVEELDKYFQIRQSDYNDNLTFRYTVSEKSNYMREYMGPMYPMYYPKNPPQIELLLDIDDLNELSWDDPYIYAFTQIRGIYEIRNRQSRMADSRYASEEKVEYEDYIPYYLRVIEQVPKNQEHPGAVIAELGLIGPENKIMSLYSAKFESGNIENVYVQPHGKYDRDTETDYVFPVYEVALQSEWSEYFKLLIELRVKRENGDPDYIWRAGSPDVVGVLNCKKQKLSDNVKYIWSEQIQEVAFDNPEFFPNGYDGKHLFVVGIVTPEQGVVDNDVLDAYLSEGLSAADVKQDPHDAHARLGKLKDNYYHFMITDGDFPADENDQVFELDEG